MRLHQACRGSKRTNSARFVVRGDCSRINTHAASMKDVFPCAFRPTSSVTSGCSSTFASAKQRKSRTNRSESMERGAESKEPRAATLRRHFLASPLDLCACARMNRAPWPPSAPSKAFATSSPKTARLRNYIADTWRVVARRYGFVEYEGPLVESTDLFRKKSGNEITAQLYCFRDKADREITLRPEVTPSLARMATARQRDFKKPIKWFQIGPCFRYEEPQEGRGREFIQFNADILGDSGPATVMRSSSRWPSTPCASLA
jgi:phenylalanyl-tRNA synthetase alpha subunit